MDATLGRGCTGKESGKAGPPLEVLLSNCPEIGKQEVGGYLHEGDQRCPDRSFTSVWALHEVADILEAVYSSFTAMLLMTFCCRKKCLQTYLHILLYLYDMKCIHNIRLYFRSALCGLLEVTVAHNKEAQM